ncbi:MAG: 3-phosphoshikimate 1-carboxyvinyltransferase [Bacteroidales bacterium]|jgi:3-phosphoshikimate 1-carboxyvinyltransferase|nr:3-phosphoshikimate 1-carboxyvinyltransferase [Bacteroidales bacterium]
MKRSINPSVVKGYLEAPTSKSMMQRAVAAALLAEGNSILRNPNYCDDAMASLQIAANLGAFVEKKKNEVLIKGGMAPHLNFIHCGESGLCLRMFTPIASLSSKFVIFNGKGSLLNRPIGIIEKALTQLSVKVTTNNDQLPLTIHGPLKGGVVAIDGSISSQLLTGLLMALVTVKNDSTIIVDNLKSKPYIDMTLQLLDNFGITLEHDNYKVFKIPGKQKFIPQDYEVEGDWSSASFMMVAAAINGELHIKGLSKNSKQGDLAIIKVLEMTGASIAFDKFIISIKNATLQAFEFNATECPDLFPPIVALAAHCNGTTVVKGVHRLVYKESNRAVVLQKEFAKMGIKIIIDGDIMMIKGGKINSTEIDSNGDHRIAMATAIAALKGEGPVLINGSECVTKSYPHFFEDLSAISQQQKYLFS